MELTFLSSLDYSLATMRQGFGCLAVKTRLWQAANPFPFATGRPSRSEIEMK